MDYSILMAIRKISSDEKENDTLRRTITQQIKSGDADKFNEKI